MLKMRYLISFIILCLMNFSLSFADLSSDISKKINSLNEKKTSLDLSYMEIDDELLKEILIELEKSNKLTYVKALYLSENKIKIIPDEIKKLSNLNTLLLDENMIEDISVLEDLSHLRELDIKKNKLKEIPLINFKKLSNIKRINLNNNEFKEIPLSLGPLKRNKWGIYQEIIIPSEVLLKTNSINDKQSVLDLADMNIDEDILKEILLELEKNNKLHYVKELNLSSNKFDEIPIEIKKLSNLKKLLLSKNMIKDISPLFELSKLESLDLSNNGLKVIPPIDFKKLSKLSDLSLKGNSYSVSESRAIGPLIKNKEGHHVKIIISSEVLLKINSINDKQSSLNLSDMNIDEEGLKKIFLELEKENKLHYVKELYLSNNKLGEIPSEIKKLSELVKLNINNNLINEIPDKIGNLERDNNGNYVIFRKNTENSHVDLIWDSKQDFSLNTECYEDIKNKILKTMEKVWPFISENHKSIILKNKKCHDLLVEQSSQYPNFKTLAQSYTPVYLKKFSKNMLDHFLDLCKDDISQKNYLDLLKQSLSDPLYGPLFASMLKEDALKNNICGKIEISFSKIENREDFFVPEIEDLKVSGPVYSDFKNIKNITGNDYLTIYPKYRAGNISSKSRKALGSEMSLLKPYGGESNNDAVVWRKANTSFEDIDFCKLIVNEVYSEPAPTSTSTLNSIDWMKSSGIIKINLPNDFLSGRLIDFISSFKGEQEVLLPPNSCFQYKGNHKEVIKEGVKEDERTVYDFLLVPWTQKKAYACYSRKLALYEANKYYGNDYKENGLGEKIAIGKFQVSRPNHGLTHGARQAYMLLDLIKFLSENEERFGELGSWAKKIRGDEKKQEIIFLMALHFRAGRLGEIGNYFPEYVSHVEKVLRKSQLITDNKEIESYANLLSEKPNLDTNEKKFIMMALDISHRTDHLRQKEWDVKESIKDQKWVIGSNGFQNEENQEKIIEFMQNRAKVYLEATGAYNIKEYGGNNVEGKKERYIEGYLFSNPDLFAELENNPSKLYQVMQENMLK